MKRKRRRRSSREGSGGPAGPAGPALRVAEGAVIVCVLLAPLLLGSVHPFAVALELGLALIALFALLWGARGAPLSLPRLPVLGLGAWLLLEALQLLPLPPFLFSLLSPQGAEVLAYSVGDLGGWPAWRPISLDPAQTALEVARHTTFFILLVVSLHLGRSRHCRRRLATALGVLAGLMVLLAFGQKLARLELVYGFFPVKPGGFLFASFVNPNHLSALLALLAPLLLGLAFGATERARALLWAIVFVLTGTTCILTLSRGGMLSFAVGMMVFAWLAYRLRAERLSVPALPEDGPVPARRAPRFSPWVAAAGLVAVIAVLFAVAYLALDPVLAELETFTHDDAISGEARLAIASDAMGLIRDHWRVGVGRGAWALTFPIHRSILRGGTYVFAESQPLQLLAELGVPAGLGVLALLVWLVVRALRRVATPRGAGLVAGLLALGVHELADFSTVFGGVAIPATVALALVAVGRRRGEAVGHARETLVLGGRGVVAAGGGLALLGVATMLAAWGRLADEALIPLQGEALDTEVFLEQVSAVQRRHPTDHMPALIAARVLSERGEGRAAMRWVSRAMYLSPTEPRPHLLAAGLLARAGQREQALLEFRLAARWGHPALAVLVAAERFFPAASDLERALPDAPAFRLQLGRYLQRRGRVEDGHRLAQAAIARWPEDPGLLGLASTLARLAGKSELALEAARTLARVAPHDPLGPLELSRALRARKDEAGAREVLEAALLRMPGNATLSLELSRLRLRAGDRTGAREALGRAAGLRGRGQRAAMQVLRGDILVAEGRSDDALDAYALAARTNPGNVLPPLRRGDLLRRLERPAEAIEAYREALRLARGRTREALEARLRALGARP